MPQQLHGQSQNQGYGVPGRNSTICVRTCCYWKHSTNKFVAACSARSTEQPQQNFMLDQRQLLPPHRIRGASPSPKRWNFRQPSNRLGCICRGLPCTAPALLIRFGSRRNWILGSYRINNYRITVVSLHHVRVHTVEEDPRVKTTQTTGSEILLFELRSIP